MNARPAGLVVELLGAPGTGKSGLARALSELDGVTVVKDHQRGDLSTLAWSLARSWPVAVAPPHDVDRRRWAAWAGRVTAASQIAEARFASGARTVVFDQGAAYTLVRMMQVRSRPHGNVWWWSRCLETAGLLDLLVILDADNDVLARRLRTRSKEHEADTMESPTLGDYLARERRACHEVADVLAREGADVRRIITTDTTVEEQVDIVREALERHHAAPAG